MCRLIEAPQISMTTRNQASIFGVSCSAMRNSDMDYVTSTSPYRENHRFMEVITSRHGQAQWNPAMLVPTYGAEKPVPYESGAGAYCRVPEVSRTKPFATKWQVSGGCPQVTLIQPSPTR